jgi:hypothetical protein
VTATAVGSSTYTITCANAAGTSAATSVSLTAAAAAPVSTGHSGGGAFGGAELLALALMGLARTRRRGALREDPSGGRGTSYSLARDAKEK